MKITFINSKNLITMYFNITKMKTFQSLFFLLAILMFGLTSCNTEDLNETTTELIEGTWEMESFLDDNVERIGNVLNSATIEFISSNSTGGSSKWELDTVLGTDENFNIIYSVINDGKKINFAGDIFTLEFIGEKIKLTGSTSSSDWIIEAKKK